MTKGETIGNGRTKSSDKEMPQLWPLWASKESYEWDSMSRKDQMSDIAALNHLKAGKGRNRMDEGWAMAHPHKNALDWAQMTSDEQKDAIRIYKIGSMAKLEIPNDISWSVREHDLNSKILNDYKFSLFCKDTPNPLPLAIINKIVDEFVDTREKCCFCPYIFNSLNDAFEAGGCCCANCDKYVCEAHVHVRMEYIGPMCENCHLVFEEERLREEMLELEEWWANGGWYDEHDWLNRDGGYEHDWIDRDGDY